MQEHDWNIKLNVVIETIGDTLVLKPGSENYKYCLVWLHGLGYYPQRFLNFFLTQQLIELLKDFKIVIPQAPVRKCTIATAETCSWYDIFIRDFSKPFDEQFSREEIENSSETIKNILIKESELLGGDWSKIFLAGFSQGCAMTYHIAFSLGKPLGGIIGYAGYLFDITNDVPDVLNVLVIHGLADTVRPWEECNKTYKKIEEKENVKFELVPEMGHDYYSAQSREILYSYLRKWCS